MKFNLANIVTFAHLIKYYHDSKIYLMTYNDFKYVTLIDTDTQDCYINDYTYIIKKNCEILPEIFAKFLGYLMILSKSGLQSGNVRAIIFKSNSTRKRVFYLTLK